MNGTNEHEGRTVDEILDTISYDGCYHYFQVIAAMEEYAAQQLASERAIRKELYQATYDWTDHMELWMEERKFRIDNADLDVLKELIRQGQKAIQKSKSLDEKK